MTAVEELGRSKYVSLTTYRKDGTAVATAVWHVPDQGELFIVSNADAWKVKRIRNDPRVLVTACDIRGRVAPGAVSAEGTARLLDDAGTQHARRLLARRYLTSRVGNSLARLLRLRRPPVVGIAVSLSPSG
ncbi:PPOX class F420-dependent oxidoreductase [Dactylosporangium sp. AC04546]|uniref:PPOX class F420-dependent oxidoreductase n=1 Tax=Dactylosporangium sp. AC04546 TaxID=2862460 RepID=UPI001EDE89EF|nr:PPOX class F420-dependent oxidoreductase [Dactylosporangium sp. AC04546]WVK80163.1 PPOX class F420-dependent oxidoreductase [Dactylosporangium sp. AC04546]